MLQPDVESRPWEEQRALDDERYRRQVAYLLERSAFYRGLVNKSVAEVNAYWAKLLFTGRASPPQVVGNSRAVLAAVRDNKSAIGYVDSADVDDSVKVVARVD